MLFLATGKIEDVMRIKSVCVLARSIVSYVMVSVIGIVAFIPVCILLLMPASWRESSTFYWYCVWLFYRIVLWCTFLPIVVKNKQNMPHEPAIIVANHQSILDIPLVGVVLGTSAHVWLGLSDFFHNRFYAFVFSRLALPIDMSTPFAGMRSLARAIAYVQKNGKHAIIFPEGGRFEDGHVHDFFGGFVMLAKKTQRSIVPLYIKNNYKIYPRGAFLVRTYPFKITVGEPMCQNPDESDEAFKLRVYAWFKASEEI